MNFDILNIVSKINFQNFVTLPSAVGNNDKLLLFAGEELADALPRRRFRERNTLLIGDIQLLFPGILKIQDAAVRGGYGGGQREVEDQEDKGVEMEGEWNRECIEDGPTEEEGWKVVAVGRYIERADGSAGGRLERILQEHFGEGETVYDRHAYSWVRGGAAAASGSQNKIHVPLCRSAGTGGRIDEGGFVLLPL